MATIDKLDIGIYFQYASRAEFVEQLNKQYHFDVAHEIPPQTQVVDYVPKPSELDIIFGVASQMTPWAYFMAPLRFRSTRRTPFTRSRVTTLFGADEEQAALESTLGSIVCANKEEENEKAALIRCCKQLGQINDWIGFITGRIGQFLQG